MDVLNSFGVDWKLLVASAINFVILLFILNKIVYKPILEVLDKRKKIIDESLKNADTIEKKLKDTEEQERNTLHKARLDAQAMLKAAEDQAVTRQKEILEQAQTQAKQLIAEAKVELEQQAVKMRKEIESGVAELVVAATKSILTDKMPTEIDQRLAAKTLSELEK